MWGRRKGVSLFCLPSADLALRPLSPLLPAGAFGVLAVTMLLSETGAGRGWGGSVHMCWQPTTCQGLPVPYSAGPLVVAKEPQSLGVVCGFCVDFFSPSPRLFVLLSLTLY